MSEDSNSYKDATYILQITDKAEVFSPFGDLKIKDCMQYLEWAGNIKVPKVILMNNKDRKAVIKSPVRTRAPPSNYIQEILKRKAGAAITIKGQKPGEEICQHTAQTAPAHLFLPLLGLIIKHYCLQAFLPNYTVQTTVQWNPK